MPPRHAPSNRRPHAVLRPPPNEADARLGLPAASCPAGACGTRNIAASLSTGTGPEIDPWFRMAVGSLQRDADSEAGGRLVAVEAPLAACC